MTATDTQRLTVETPTLLPCPFCYGEGLHQRELRDGYEEFIADPSAYAYWVLCRSCAATGGWAKTESGAARRWNMRATKDPLLTVRE